MGHHNIAPVVHKVRYSGKVPTKIQIHTRISRQKLYQWWYLETEKCLLCFRSPWSGNYYSNFVDLHFLRLTQYRSNELPHVVSKLPKINCHLSLVQNYPGFSLAPLTWEQVETPNFPSTKFWFYGNLIFIQVLPIKRQSSFFFLIFSSWQFCKYLYVMVRRLPKRFTGECYVYFRYLCVVYWFVNVYLYIKMWNVSFIKTSKICIYDSFGN